MNTKTKAIIASYLRAAVAAVIALWLAGVQDPKALAMAGVSAIAGPVLKWLDPKSVEFGRGSE
jgi:hypothetical protein